jgi:hypothetical protein
MFKTPIRVMIGETLERDGYLCTDVIPAEAPCAVGSSTT